MPPEVTITPEDAKRQVEDAIKQEKERSTSILQTGQLFGQEDLAREYINDGRSVKEFNAEVLKRKKEKESNPDTRSTPQEPAQVKQGFRSLGENLSAIITAETTGTVDERLLDHKDAQDGGYYIDSQFDNDLMTKTFESSPILSRVDRLPIDDVAKPIVTESRLQKSDSGKVVDVFWMEDNAEYRDSDVTFEPWETRAFKMGGKYEVTEQMLSSNSQLESIMENAITTAFVEKGEDGVIHGNGIKKPLGFLKAKSLVLQPKESGQDPNTVTTPNILNMFARIFRIDDSVVWVIARSAMPQIMGLTHGNAPMYMPPGGIPNAPNGTLLGLPIAYNDDVPGLGQQGDVNLVRLRDYRMVDNQTTEFASSIHVKFLRDTNTIKFRRYMGGQPKSHKTIKTNGNFETSNYITLEKRV